MTREILFRGKRIDNGEWVEGLLSKRRAREIQGGVVAYTGEWEWYINSHESPYIGTWRVDPATIGQFTGLTDLYGDKIFEGDILESPYLNLTLGEVLRRYKVYEFSYYLNSRDIVSDNVGSAYIIGNIHDNPELL